MKIQPVRGTHDLYGEMLNKFKRIQTKVDNLANIYDFNEIITPIFESNELFKKPLGEQSDVVLKEMYSFSDKGDSLLTLKPELTTPILRAAISNNFLDILPQKLYSIGPCFRRERPQKGRYRQFNQINFEILGTYDSLSDVELILLADDILKSIFSKKNIKLQINSLGDKNTLTKYKSKLSDYFLKYKDELSFESASKIQSNPLRILDSKDDKDIKINKTAPKISNFYTKDAEEKFYNVKNLLTNNSIDYIVNNNLVRGLDYYCHTVFEFKSNDLGSQNTLIGGGRYDGLIKTLGGPDIPGVGWAGGIERILMLMQDSFEKEKKVHVILMNEKFKDFGSFVVNELRKNKVRVYFDYKYHLKKSLSKANQNKIEFAVIIGENEYKNKICTLKNLKNKTQKTIEVDKIIKELI